MVAEGNIDIGAGAAVELQSRQCAGWVAVLHALAGLDIVETLPPTHGQAATCMRHLLNNRN